MDNKIQDMKSVVAELGYNTVLASIKGKDKKVVNKIFETFEMIGGDNDMLTNAFVVYKRLYEHIKHLTPEEQFNIIYESTMIAYDARISAFDYVLNHKPKLKLPENGS